MADVRGDGAQESVGRREFAWPWVLAGLLVGSRIADSRERTVRARDEARVDLPARPTGLDSAGERVPSARELRAVDGVGPVRAQRLARAWWENGPPESARCLEALEDVGPETAAKVWDALGRPEPPCSSSSGLPPRLPVPSRPP